MSTPTKQQLPDVEVHGGGEASTVPWACAVSKGRREHQEDKHLALDLGAGTSCFAVFDGHSGKEVSSYASHHLPAHLARSLAQRGADLRAALHDALMSLDAHLKSDTSQVELYAMRKGLSVPKGSAMAPAPAGAAAHAAGASASVTATTTEADEAEGEEGALRAAQVSRAEQVQEGLPDAVVDRARQYGVRDGDGKFRGPAAGSTAVVALVQDGQLAVANVGDSRCVLSINGRAQMLTRDHKPNLPEEAARIASAGEVVGSHREGGVPRVGMSLAMSRALGDVRFKKESLPPEQQAVTAVPDIVKVALNDDCEFMVLASDGVWDVTTPQLVINNVHDDLDAGHSLKHAAKSVVAKSLDAKHGLGPSLDNITCMVVRFRHVHHPPHPTTLYQGHGVATV